MVLIRVIHPINLFTNQISHQNSHYAKNLSCYNLRVKIINHLCRRIRELLI